MRGRRGICRNHDHRATVYTIARKTGGAYNRASGWRTSGICEECARGLVRYMDEHPQRRMSIYNWSVSDLRRLVADLDAKEEAR